jgi:hypothetical protein
VGTLASRTSSSLGEEAGVRRDIGVVLGGHVVLLMDRADRALVEASAAVNALLGVDVELQAGVVFASLRRGRTPQRRQGIGPSMQSTGQTVTQTVSQVPAQRRVMTWAMNVSPGGLLSRCRAVLGR